MKFLIAFLSFLPSIVFAQRTQDIGELIFRDILRMTEYPGAPFTGIIINDLVLFLFIPSVFIIIVIYTLSQRITIHPKLNLLLSLAFYMFIVFGGYYRIFALLAGPYFLFLIIIMGLFFFFLGHFGFRRGGAAPAAGGGAGAHPMSSAAVGNNPYVGWDYNNLRRELNKANEELRHIEKRMHEEEAKRDKLIRTAGSGVHIEAESRILTQLGERRLELETRKTNIEYAMGFLKGKL